MKLIKYMGMTLVISTFVSCNSDDEALSTWESNPRAVQIQAVVDGGLLSRSNPIEGKENEFNEGDQLSIRADKQGPYIYILNQNEWVPTGSEYLVWKSSTMKVSAYTVFNSATQNSFKVPNDQSSREKIASADYMTFTGTCVMSGNSSNLTMQLQRQTARIDITINPTFGKQSVTDLEIVGNSEISNGTGSKIATFSPYVHQPTKKRSIYSVLVAPNDKQQTDSTFITLKVNNKKKTVTGIPIAEKGKKYTYTLNISKKEVTLSSVSVTNWTTGEIFDGGEIGSSPIKVDKANHTIITKQSGKLTAGDIQNATSTDGKLTIIGPLNSSDMLVIGKQTAEQKQPSITSLDLSNAVTNEIPNNVFGNSKELTSYLVFILF